MTQQTSARRFATAEIIAVGSEMLTPHRSDTNSLAVTARLNELGIQVRVKTVVGDDRANLTAVFIQARARADLAGPRHFLPERTAAFIEGLARAGRLPDPGIPRRRPR